ncbi:MAG: hypothetical protein HYT43_01490 [Candidatus Taylorbacteria bacterium]|nr:hypothetical protein [Candidatus Taylorbacteria bacterium]
MLQTLAVIFYSFFVLSGFGSPDSAFLSAPPERPRVKVIIVPGHDDEYPGPLNRFWFETRTVTSSRSFHTLRARPGPFAPL